MSDKKEWLVIHKHALWLCLALCLAAGLMWGFFLGALVTR